MLLRFVQRKNLEHHALCLGYFPVINENSSVTFACILDVTTSYVHLRAYNLAGFLSYLFKYMHNNASDSAELSQREKINKYMKLYLSPIASILIIPIVSRFEVVWWVWTCLQLVKLVFA